LIQLGIDHYGQLLSGAKWRPNGGHNNWKKLPILIAGQLLDHAGMLAIGTDYPASTNTFAEDSSTFLLGAGDVSRILNVQIDIAVTSGGTGAVTGTITRPVGAPANPTQLNGYATVVGNLVEVVSGTGTGQVRMIASSSQTRGVPIPNGGSLTITPDTAWSPALDNTSVVRILGYQAAQTGSYQVRWQGTAEWGISHIAYGSTGEFNDNPSLDADYRQCCTFCAASNNVLAALALDLKTAWAHDPMFDYTDWYMDEAGFDQLYKTFSSTYRTFMQGLWDTHRSSF
jgi:hypothetical protein